MWNGPYSWYLPFLMGVVFLVYIVRGLKQSSMELGLQQNQSMAAWDFCLFVFFCFHHLSANSGHLPSFATCWVQQVQLYQSWPLSPLVSSCLIKPLLQTGPATSLLRAHLQPKLHIPLLGPPSSLTFQFTIFSHLGYGSVFLLDLWWVFLLLWVQASVYSGTAHVVQIYVSFKERLLPTLPLSLYLVIILNP